MAFRAKECDVGDEVWLTEFKQKMLFHHITFDFSGRKQPMVILYQYGSHTSVKTDTRSFLLLFPDLSLEIPAEFQIRKSKTRDPQLCQLEGEKQNYF